MTMPARKGSIPVKARRFYIGINVKKAVKADAYSLKECQIARALILSATKKALNALK